MGLLDGFLESAPGLQQMVAGNPNLARAALALLNPSDPSVGGSGGLASLIGAFQQNGLGDMMKAWISTGPNPPVSGAQLEGVLGREVLGQFAQKAGVPSASAGGALASILPGLVDHLTPDGNMPQAANLQGAIGSLLGLLGR